MSALSALRIGELLGVAEPEKPNTETEQKEDVKKAEVIDFNKDSKDSNVEDAKDEVDDKITVIKEKAGKVADKAKDVAEKATEKAKEVGKKVKGKKDKSTKDDILPGVILPTDVVDVVDANDNADDDFEPVDDSAEDEALASLLNAVKDMSDSNDDASEYANNDTTDASDEDDGADAVIRTEPTEEEKDMAVAMKGMDFYQGAGQKIYDVDRGMDMDGELKSWIVEQFMKDKDLAKAVIKTLPAIIAGNPKLVPDLKRMIKDAAELNVPYTVTYLDKVTEKEYESREQAMQATEELRSKLGLKFSEVCRLVYRKISDGKLGKVVSREEVETFVASFDGNREALAEKLQLKKPNKPDKPNGNKSDSKPDKPDKSSDKKEDK